MTQPDEYATAVELMATLRWDSDCQQKVGQTLILNGNPNPSPSRDSDCTQKIGLTLGLTLGL